MLSELKHKMAKMSEEYPIGDARVAIGECIMMIQEYEDVLKRQQKESAWIVATDEEGIILTTDNLNEALAEYESQTEEYRDYVNDNSCFYGCENVILAKVQKRLYAIEEENSFMDWKEDNLF